ncbi:MAG: 4'-phosphopantetheinyl transferase superfamily protein [Ruminococcaceae bacterium]|nr:4'-phosphopantetheinyl transferase superfamily protein [Oscillospiraceae bacterium]
MIKYIFDIKDLSEADYKHYLENMADLRRKKVSRLKLKADKYRTVSGEMLVKQHFGEDSIIEIGEKGKPFLVNKKGEFSVSHSGSYVLLSVSDEKTGADIECIRPLRESLIKKICTPEEAVYVEASDEFDKNIRLLLIWTFKEAYFKYLGTGIGNFKSVSYFDESIKREKKVTESFVYHIIYSI